MYYMIITSLIRKILIHKLLNFKIRERSYYIIGYVEFAYDCVTLFMRMKKFQLKRIKVTVQTENN